VSNYFPNQIRTAARAIVIREGRLLVVKMQDRDGVFYILPGGGQKAGETFYDTLHRECVEEIGVNVRIGEFMFVREYIGRNHAFSYRHANFHQVESVFRCYIDDIDSVRVGDLRDMRQIGVDWLELRTLKEARFYPKVLADYIVGDDIVVTKQYLGDVN
jgi:8-oxo-dGTP diphosphatase